MPSQKVNLNKDARLVLEEIRGEVEKRRAKRLRKPSYSDAVLELARLAGKY